MERILVTGVGGFIGSHVARRFIREGYNVVGVDDLSSGRMENVPAGLQFIRGDLSKLSTISLIPPGCRKILHLAGQSSGEISFDDPVADLEKNTVSSLNLIRYGIQNCVDRLVYASSMSVYGPVGCQPVAESHACNPLSCYGVGKYATESYLRIYQDRLPSVSMRMFNVYGPGQDMGNLRQGMVSIYLSQALTSRSIKVKGSIDRFRDFIFIDDVVEAWFRATIYPSAVGQTFNIGTGIKTTVASLLRQICELVPGANYFTEGDTPGDQKGIYADTRSIASCLGLTSFTSINQGLKKFFEWAQAST
jgi:UDP-glucose 4-epimerase